MPSRPINQVASKPLVCITRRTKPDPINSGTNAPAIKIRKIAKNKSANPISDPIPEIKSGIKTIGKSTTESNPIRPFMSELL